MDETFATGSAACAGPAKLPEFGRVSLVVNLDVLGQGRETRYKFAFQPNVIVPKFRVQMIRCSAAPKRPVRCIYPILGFFSPSPSERELK